MRFLLLCPAVLLLLAAPAITIPTDSPTDARVETESTVIPSGKSIASSPSTTSTTPSASPVESVVTEKTAVLDDPEPGEVWLLRKKLADARVTLKNLLEDHEKLEKALNKTRSKVKKLSLKKAGLASELALTRKQLQNAQYKLDTEEAQEGICKPSQSELLKLVEEEATRKVAKRKAEINRFYEKKYENLIKDLRLRIRREWQLTLDIIPT